LDVGFIEYRRRQLKRKRVMELLNSGSTSIYTIKYLWKNGDVIQGLMEEELGEG